MDNIYSWIYVNNKDKIWKFSLNDNRELEYSIMDSHGRWTEVAIISNDVVDFTVYVEKDNIHIIYSNIKNELIYCTMENNKWVGKLLNRKEEKKLKIKDLKIEVIENNMHIFYLLKKNDYSDHSILMHALWDGNETSFTPIQDIITSDLKVEYKVSVDKNNNICVIFATDTGNEFSIEYSSFNSNSWTTAKRLYGIEGEDINLEVIKNKGNLNILNKYKKDLIYCLDHVIIEDGDDINVFEINESDKELTEPLLFISDDKLYCSWIEKNKIFYSDFNDETWSSPNHFDNGKDHTVKKYGFYHINNNEVSFRERKIYGTDDLDLNLLIPSKFVVKANELLALGKDKDNTNKMSYNTRQINEDKNQNKNLSKNLKIKDPQTKLQNKVLEKRIESLTMQLEKIKQQLSEEIEFKTYLEDNLRRCKEANINIKSEFKTINEANQNISSKFEDIKKENISIKSEFEAMIKENKEIYRELKRERGLSNLSYE